MSISYIFVIQNYLNYYLFKEQNVPVNIITDMRICLRQTFDKI